MSDTIYFSAATGGFYHASIHGARQIAVVDEDAQAEAMVSAEVLDAAATKELRDAAEVLEADPRLVGEVTRNRRAMIDNPIMHIIDNPACRVPSDAVEVDPADHAEFVMSGRPVVADRAGRPMLGEIERSTEETLVLMRRRRDRALASSDRTQLADAPLSAAKKKAWAVHRQRLRDLPALIDAAIADGRDPAEIAFPEAPAA